MSTATEPRPDTPPAAPEPPYPPDVEAFCAAHQLRPHLDTAVRIAREVFPTLLELTTEVEEDYESPRKWVTIRVVVPPGILGDGRASWEYFRREAKAIPADPADLIRMAAHTVQPG